MRNVINQSHQALPEGLLTVFICVRSDTYHDCPVEYSEKEMNYGIEVVPFGDFGDPGQIVRLAQVAEAYDWERLWF